MKKIIDKSTHTSFRRKKLKKGMKYFNNKHYFSVNALLHKVNIFVKVSDEEAATVMPP